MGTHTMMEHVTPVGPEVLKPAGIPVANLVLGKKSYAALLLCAVSNLLL